jgi:hypothetical protein
MSESSKSKPAPASHNDRAGERQQRDDATEPAKQFGATEQQITPLTPPTSEKPAKKLPPDASTKQKAAEEVDPADEITPG